MELQLTQTTKLTRCLFTRGLRIQAKDSLDIQANISPNTWSQAEASVTTLVIL